MNELISIFEIQPCPASVHKNKWNIWKNNHKLNFNYCTNYIKYQHRPNNWSFTQLEFKKKNDRFSQFLDINWIMWSNHWHHALSIQNQLIQPHWVLQAAATSYEGEKEENKSYLMYPQGKFIYSLNQNQEFCDTSIQIKKIMRVNP